MYLDVSRYIRRTVRCIHLPSGGDTGEYRYTTRYIVSCMYRDTAIHPDTMYRMYHHPSGGGEGRRGGEREASGGEDGDATTRTATVRRARGMRNHSPNPTDPTHYPPPTHSTTYSPTNPLTPPYSKSVRRLARCARPPETELGLTHASYE